MINLSDEAGPVAVAAFTDGGVGWEGTSFRIEGNAVFAFNSDDLEYGDPGKGLTGIGTGDGDWHLTLDSELPLTVSTYARSADGLLTEMNRTVPRDPDGIHRVMTFNPKSAMRRVSQLRLVNAHERPVTVTVRGIDDTGKDGDGQVTVTLAANEARTLTAGQLEDRGLGDGAGKWRLFVTATEPITDMNLMRTVSGHLANLSSAPEAELEDYMPYNEDDPDIGDIGTVIPLFTSADAFRQSFARIINRSDAAGTVIVEATDDSGTVHGQFRLPIGAKQERSFTSNDLENGNRGRGIPARANEATIFTSRQLESMGLGDGTAKWRLVVSADNPVGVMNLMRTPTGHLTNTCRRQKESSQTL